MIAIFTIGFLSMFAIQATAPPDISGNWQGEDWGQVVLTQVRGFAHRILRFGPWSERKSFGDGSGLGERCCSEDLLH